MFKNSVQAALYGGLYGLVVSAIITVIRYDSNFSHHWPLMLLITFSLMIFWAVKFRFALNGLWLALSGTGFGIICAPIGHDLIGVYQCQKEISVEKQEAVIIAGDVRRVIEIPESTEKVTVDMPVGSFIGFAFGYLLGLALYTAYSIRSSNVIDNRTTF